MKYGTDPIILKARLNHGRWIDVGDSVSNFERKIEELKTIEELKELF
jgi:hypothetical protein